MQQPGNVSLQNIVKFIGSGLYSYEGLPEQTPGNIQKVHVKKRICNKDVVFDVYDSVAGFSSSKWKRVVAVFVNGQEW